MISNNRFYKVSSGIGVSGARVSVTGNEIKDATATGISTGDDTEIGVINITGNNIELFEGTGNPRVGIIVEGANVTDRTVNVVGNVVRYVGVSTGNGICYRQTTAPYVQFTGNTAEIQVRGTGFSVLGSVAGNSIGFSSNEVRVFAESGTSYGFKGQPNDGANTLNLISSNNKVYGVTRAQGSYAYDYSGSGTLTGSSSNDWAEQGYVRIGATIYGNGPVPALDGVPFSDNLTISAFADFSRYQQISVLNLQKTIGAGLTISSGVVTLAGVNGGTGSPFKQTRVIIGTEGSAATDDLDTINGAEDGDVIILQSIDSGRDPTVKNGTGNILCGSDFTLTTTADRITLIYDGSLSKWVQISRSTN